MMSLVQNCFQIAFPYSAPIKRIGHLCHGDIVSCVHLVFRNLSFRFRPYERAESSVVDGIGHIEIAGHFAGGQIPRATHRSEDKVTLIDFQRVFKGHQRHLWNLFCRQKEW